MKSRPLRAVMFRVASRLGMTVRELGERMGGDELVEWIAFMALENGEEIGYAASPFDLGM